MHKQCKDNSGLGQLGGFDPVVYCGPLVFTVSSSSSEVKSIRMDEGKLRKMCGHTGAALGLRTRMTPYVAK